MAIVGVLHPGAMGSAVGAALRAQGHEALWASEGRSAATAARAQAAAMRDAGTVAAVLGRAEVVLSICPPHAALETAELAAGFEGVYVDANAVSPDTARAAQAAVGGRFVDGGVIGPPPAQRGTTRLYLSGEEAAVLAFLQQRLAREVDKRRRTRTRKPPDLKTALRRSVAKASKAAPGA